MLLDGFPAGQAKGLGHVQADIFRFPALVLDPFLDHLFVTHDFDAGLEGFDRHPREAVGVELAQLVLVIVMVGRAEDHAAEAALRHESIFAFRRLGGSAFAGCAEIAGTAVIARRARSAGTALSGAWAVIAGRPVTRAAFPARWRALLPATAVIPCAAFGAGTSARWTPATPVIAAARSFFTLAAFVFGVLRGRRWFLRPGGQEKLLQVQVVVRCGAHSVTVPCQHGPFL